MRARGLLVLLSIWLPALNAGGQESLADLLQEPGTDLSRPVDRERVSARMAEIQAARRERARAKAMAAGLPVRREFPDGRVIEIESFDGPQPVYHATQNANAAISTGANLLRVSPYSLAGGGVTIGMWDGGSGRSTHQEFGSRMVVKDGSASVDHATHVGGTLAASGVVANARGMAASAVVDSYDWNNDLSEMTNRGATAAGQEATRIYLSNHSYGYISGWNYVGGAGSPARTWEWHGSGTTSTSIEDDFGRYNTYARDVDSLAAGAPYYLIFQSAGNDRTDNPANGQSVALTPGGSTVVGYDSATHPAGDGTYRGGFESLGFRAVAKNVLTVGSTTDAVSSGLRSPANANISSFSSWGPTDDGRIKPDVVANGDGLYSSLNGGNASYGTYSGTSMSTPNACGSAALLVQQYGQLFPGQAMRAATLKGLLIHTADDRGNPGPDYKYGWGLVNVKAAADLLIDHQAHPNKLRVHENQLSTSVTTRSHSFLWDGVSPIRATLSWTDPAGAATTTSDSRAARLVNNLQLKLISPAGTEHLPYVMPFVGTWTQASMDLPATTGVNNTDNVEQVFVSAPGAAGTWRAVISFSGTLANNQQNYSLLLSGSSGEEVPPPPLALASISPASGLANSNVTVDLTGTSLRADTVVKLTKSGQTDIAATSPQLIGESLRCQLNLTGAAAGIWDVVATNPDSSTSTLAAAFTVIGAIWHENFDGTLSGWSSVSDRGSNSWSVVTTKSHTPSKSYFAPGPSNQTTTNLVSPSIPIPSGASNLQLKFWHDLQFGNNSDDAGCLELSVNGGSWFDAGSSGSGTAFASNGYNATLRKNSQSDLANRPVWKGGSNGFIETILNLTDSSKFAGKPLRLRWRLATDNKNASTGWHVDSIVLIGGGDLSNQPPAITSAATSSSTETQTDAEGTVWRVERGTSTTLSVMASDDGGEAALTYTWSANGPAPVFFGTNASNAAKTTEVEFQQAGDHVATVTITDPQGLAVSGSVNLRVVQTASGLVVSPAVASVGVGATQSFGAVLNDQFGDPMTSQPPSFTWAASGGGTIDAAGLFTATTAGGPFAVSATSGAFGDFASVTVLPAAATVSLGDLQQIYDGTPKHVSIATDPPGLACAVTYDSQPEAPVTAGTYQIEAVVSDPNYQGSASGVLTVEKAAQTIVFPPPGIMTYGDAPWDAGASADSGLAVSYASSHPAVATVDGSTITIVGAGTTTITATQDGDANFEAASPVERILSVEKAPATVMLGDLEHTEDGTPKSVTATTDPEGLAVIVTYDGSTTPPSAAGTYEVIATVSDDNHQGSASGSMVIAPGKDYRSWCDRSFDEEQRAAGLADVGADPDADGLSNLAEYALGADPLAFTPAVTAALDESGLWFTFTRPSGLPGITYTAESSDDAETWSPVLLEVLETGETETLRARDPAATSDSPRRFLRLRFTKE